MIKRKLGCSGIEVSAIGLGCMGMDHVYGPSANRQEMMTLIQKAVDLGCNFLTRRLFMERLMKNY